MEVLPAAPTVTSRYKVEGGRAQAEVEVEVCLMAERMCGRQKPSGLGTEPGPGPGPLPSSPSTPGIDELLSRLCDNFISDPR